MGQKRHSKPIRRKCDQAESVAVPTSSHQKKILNRSLFALTFFAAGLLTVISIQPNWFTEGRDSKPLNNPTVLNKNADLAVSQTKLHSNFKIEPKTLNELLDLPKEKLDKVDIARINLLCASELPATRELDVEHALKKLDEWAQRVAYETDRHLYRVNDPLFAKHYGNSEAQYRAEMLTQVLYEDLNIKYNPEAINSFSFTDPSVAFIHGMIPASGKTTADTPGGTCVSMPVLYVAVGRRLGYPLKLVTTDSHIFVRWDTSNTDWYVKPKYSIGESFNIETTNGFNRYNDDYYRAWPRILTEQEVLKNGYLVSLSPAEEFAQFMAARGHHAMDVGQYAFATRCYENAFRSDGSRPCFSAWFLRAAQVSDYQTKTPELQQMLLQANNGPQKKKKPQIPNGHDLQDPLDTVLPQSPKPFGVQVQQLPNPNRINQ
ncbi:hypothetical protein JD969_04515 [Planctomycetota bacterium]|nr:hypothetical protein JD969_04515 [Planctomycetota bacterium]